MIENILVPIFVCVVLPVAIVYIVFRAATNKDNKQAEIIIKAIEANNDMDIKSIVESMQKPKKSARDVLYKRLLYGCIFTLVGLALFACYYLLAHQGYFIGGAVCLAMGIGYLVVYFVTRKQVIGSTETEEK